MRVRVRTKGKGNNGMETGRDLRTSKRGKCKGKGTGEDKGLGRGEGSRVWGRVMVKGKGDGMDTGSDLGRVKGVVVIVSVRARRRAGASTW